MSPDQELPSRSERPVARLSWTGFLRTTYSQSLKSSRSDEWINTYAIRPAASVLVWVFARLGLRPVQVVLLSAATGTAAGLSLVLVPGRTGLVLGGALLLAKVVLDAADGQLARATGQVDRIGRFADSIADFWVNGWITLGAAVPAAATLGTGRAALLGAAAFLLVLLQCSLFVFYQVTFLGAVSRSPANRTDERPLEAEKRASALERRLQRTYLRLYGWQDRLMAFLDRALLRRALRRFAGRAPEAEVRQAWYSDATALRGTSFLGLGTSNVVYGVLLLAGWPVGALLWVVVVESGVALAALAYRFFWPKTALTSSSTKR